MFNHLRFIFCIMFFSLITFHIIGQESPEPSPKFPVGTFLGRDMRANQTAYDTLAATGMNTVIQYAADSTKPFLSDYKLIASNQDRQSDWISFYATGFYSRWEGEENQTDPDKVGVKHKNGQSALWKNKLCWSSQGLSSASDSLVYGPHYHQEKVYKRWNFGPDHVSYIARYEMALNNFGHAGSNTNVCRITVRVRHAVIIDGNWDSTVVVDTLKGPITF